MVRAVTAAEIVGRSKREFLGKAVAWSACNRIASSTEVTCKQFENGEAGISALLLLTRFVRLETSGWRYVC